MAKQRGKMGEYAILGAAALAGIYILTLKTEAKDGNKETIIEKITRDTLRNVTDRTGDFIQGAGNGIIDTGRGVIGGRDENKNPVGLVGGLMAPTWFIGNPLNLAAPGTKKGVTVAPPPSTVQDVYAAGGTSQDYVDYARNYLSKKQATTDVIKGNPLGYTVETVRTGAGFVLPSSQAAAFIDPVGDAQFAERLTKKQGQVNKAEGGLFGYGGWLGVF